MLDWFLLARWLWWAGTLSSLGAFTAKIAQSPPDWPRWFPFWFCSLHGVVFYTVYLTYWYHPRLVFDLQFFANWGSVVVGQGFWTLAFVGWDLVNGWFSFHLLPWAMRRTRTFKMLV